MISTRHMLAQLNARIITDDGTAAIVQVIPDMPHATVRVPSAHLREWCVRRLTTRLSHRGYGIGCGIMKKRSY